ALSFSIVHKGTHHPILNCGDLSTKSLKFHITKVNKVDVQKSRTNGICEYDVKRIDSKDLSSFLFPSLDNNSLHEKM
ncbi:hypothetical protein PENTCL1PPCAC_7741, partial [Pristionchus entomophagus]